MFRVGVELLISPSMKEILEILEKPTHEAALIDGIVFDGWHNGWVTMALRSTVDLEALVHECNHVKNRVFSRMGYDVDPENDEMESYFLGWFAQKVLDSLNEHVSIVPPSSVGEEFDIA